VIYNGIVSFNLGPSNVQQLGAEGGKVRPPEGAFLKIRAHCPKLQLRASTNFRSVLCKGPHLA